MNLSSEEEKKEVDEVLVSASNNISGKECTPQHLLSAAIFSRDAVNMRNLINNNNIAEGEDDIVEDVMKALIEARQAHEKQRSLDEQRKRQLRKELTDSGWEPQRRDKNRDFGITVLKRMLEERVKAAKEREEKREEKKRKRQEDAAENEAAELEKKTEMLNALKELGWEPLDDVNYGIKYLQNKLKKMKEERESLLEKLVNFGYVRSEFDEYNNDELENLVAEEKAKVLNELKELGWEPPAGVNHRIKYLQNKLKKMKEERYSLLIDLHNLGHRLVIGESYKNYTNKELKNLLILLIAAKEKAENRRAAADQDALCRKAGWCG